MGKVLGGMAIGAALAGGWFMWQFWLIYKGNAK